MLRGLIAVEAFVAGLGGAVIRGLGRLVRLAGWLRVRRRLVLAGASPAAGGWCVWEVMRGMSAHRNPVSSRGCR